MASIFGVSIVVTSITNHNNDELATHSGNVYMNGNKIGRFFEDCWDKKLKSKLNSVNEVEAISKKYFDTFGFTQHKDVVPTVDDFLNIVLYLKAAEDLFKQNGCSVVMIIDNVDVHIAVLPENSTLEDAQKLLNFIANSPKAYAFLFSTINDFEIR